MSKPQLPNGVYDLTVDIVNPHVDRRQKHDWTRAPIIKAGERFIVRDSHKFERGAPRREIIMLGEYEFQSLLFDGLMQDLIDLLTPHLKLVEGREASFDARWGSGVDKIGAWAVRLLRRAYIEERIGDAWIEAEMAKIAEECD